MGAGQLNAKRALQQFSGGEYEYADTVTTPAPVHAWDLGFTDTQTQERKYILAPVKGGSYISVTLVWDRLVSLTDTNDNNSYDIGETFTTGTMADLDLFLMPKGATDVTQKIWSSVSDIQNVEHILFKLPNLEDEVELWVRQQNNVGATYALAWWAVSAPPLESLPGWVADRVWHDQNADGIQDTGEPGAENVRVDLYDTSDVWMATTVTDENGDYAFADVPAGDYYIVFTTEAGYGFTSANVGSDDTVDSDADSAGRTSVFTVGSSSIDTIDAGLVPVSAASFGDFVWEDLDGDGIQDSGEAGVADVVYPWD